MITCHYVIKHGNRFEIKWRMVVLYSLLTDHFITYALLLLSLHSEVPELFVTDSTRCWKHSSVMCWLHFNDADLPFHKIPKVLDQTETVTMETIRVQ